MRKDRLRLRTSRAADPAPAVRAFLAGPIRAGRAAHEPRPSRAPSVASPDGRHGTAQARADASPRVGRHGALQALADRRRPRPSRAPAAARARAAAAAPVQRFTRVPAGGAGAGPYHPDLPLRVSDDGAVAVADTRETKNAWATTGVIAHGGDTLLALGSPFWLMPGSETLQGPGGGALHRVVPSNTDSCGFDRGMTTIESCSSHGQHLLGAGLGVGDHSMARGMAVVRTDVDTDRPREHRYDKRGGTGKGRTDTEVMKDTLRDIAGPDSASPEADYERLSEGARREHALIRGINQYADPEVGEGLAVYAAVEARRTGFPMHFAGVVMKSGPDYVTLENYARQVRGASATASTEWYFQMYGPEKETEDQSFYGQKAALYGGREGAMVLRHRAVEGFPLPAAVHLGRQVKDVSERFVQRTDGVTRAYPTFVGAYQELRAALADVETAAAEAWVAGQPLDEVLVADLEDRIVALVRLDAYTSILGGRVPEPEHG